MRGFFATLTTDQRAAVLAYRGDENHGNEAFRNSQAFPSVGPADTAGGAFLPASSAPIPHPVQNLPSEQAIASAGAEIAAASPFYSED